MAVEDRRTGDDSASIDKFPIGLRVLAVDDDPICLKVLENLLRKCQYEVTTTSQAATALKMLRENKNNYDLVISDVNMPDIDGFKLLELVGLEMDLPVIMLSAYSDTKLVMKGISHGACDYLLKPVRIEELKNIWQHVIRKKKLKPRDRNEKGQYGGDEGGQAVSSTSNSDQMGKASRKRKDQEEDDEDGDEDENDNEDSTSQKKPRVVWSVELHQKFVTAVNQLGFEKAVPKKILELMNVEWISRENVASHLQKYRLYLKRISQQPNMVDALGSKDPTFMHMVAVDGFGEFRTLTGPGRFSSTSISSSYQPGSMLGRLNSSTGLTMRGIGSSSIIPPSHSQTLRNSYNTLGKLQNSMLPVNQNAFFNGLQSPLDVNQQLQTKSTTSLIGDPSATTSFSASQRSLIGDPLQRSGTFGNQSSIGVAQLNPGSFNLSVGGSSSFLDHYNQMPKFPSSMPLSEPFGLPQTNLNNNNMHSQFSNNSLDQSVSMFNQPFNNINSLGGGITSCDMAPFSSGTTVHNSAMNSDAKLKSSDEHLFDSSLDDIMNTMMKRDQSDPLLGDAEFGFDDYSSCL